MTHPQPIVDQGPFSFVGGFVVYGRPRPQGSMRPILNPHTGKTFQKYDEKLINWRARVADKAAEAWDQPLLVDCAVSLSLAFYFPKPKSVKRPLPWVRPDASKLVRAVEDGLEGIVFQNDAQVCIEQIGKFYGEPARVEIEIAVLTDQLDLELQPRQLFNSARISRDGG